MANQGGSGQQARANHGGPMTSPPTKGKLRGPANSVPSKVPFGATNNTGQK